MEARLLFLLNDQVIDIGAPEGTLIDMVGALGVKHDRLCQADVVELGQEVYLRAGRGAEPAYETRVILACLIAMKLRADAAEFAVGRNARRAKDVKTRFAAASPPLVSHLYEMQRMARLSSKVVNEKVWAAAVRAG